MGRRGGTWTLRCSAAGCRESSFVTYDSQRELREMLSRDYYSQWKCVRHTQPEKNLTPDRQAVSAVLVCVEKEYGRFWQQEGHANAGSRFDHSSAHKAYAEDWQPGTRLVVTAYIETPEQAEIVTALEAEGA